MACLLNSLPGCCLLVCLRCSVTILSDYMPVFLFFCLQIAGACLCKSCSDYKLSEGNEACDSSKLPLHEMLPSNLVLLIKQSSFRLHLSFALSCFLAHLRPGSHLRTSTFSALRMSQCFFWSSSACFPVTEILELFP